MMFDFIIYSIFGFFGFLFLLVILTVIFGKKVDKKWEYEADFKNVRGREIGEFDIELVRYPKQENDYQLKTKLFLRHESLEPGAEVTVVLDDNLVMRGPVASKGLVRLGKEHLVGKVSEPQTGQICLVLCSGQEICRAALHPD